MSYKVDSVGLTDNQLHEIQKAVDSANSVRDSKYGDLLAKLDEWRLNPFENLWAYVDLLELHSKELGYRETRYNLIKMGSISEGSQFLDYRAKRIAEAIFLGACNRVALIRSRFAEFQARQSVSNFFGVGLGAESYKAVK